MRKTFIAAALAAAAAGVAAEPVTFNIDPGHTVVTFEALHMNTSTQRGRIQAKEGSVVIDRAAKTGKADITLDLTTLSAASSSLEGTLKGERLFNVAQGPTARFVGDTFTFDGRQARFGGGNADDPRQVAADDTQGDALQLLRERAAQARGVRRRLHRHDPAQPVRPRLPAERDAGRRPSADPGRGDPPVAGGAYLFAST